MPGTLGRAWVGAHGKGQDERRWAGCRSDDD